MSDEEVLNESDEENEIQDLEQLNAVLVDDEPCSSTSISQCSFSTESYGNLSKYEQCSKIDAALALNHMCDEKLRRLEKILNNRLAQCREKLKEIQQLPNVDTSNKAEIFHYISCGKPYFKDSLNFPAPDNEDTIVMAKSEMYDFSNITSVAGWTVIDKKLFLKLLLEMSQEIKKNELNSQIAELRRQKKNNPKKSNNKIIDNKIANLQSEINLVKEKNLEDLALPIDQEYDWYAIANKLNKRHNANEYRSLWKLFLHPSINKKAWSRNEHISLQKIAFDEKLQDWEHIAKKLNTGRTNYQCFVYFRTNMSNTFTGRKWTKEEVEYLKRLIDYYREEDYIPWGKVATSMENRTKIQIYNKYLSLCQQRKGRFLPEEDAVILTCAESFGVNFQKMTEYLPGRTSAQCRVRYQVLAKKRISTVWTIEEDKRLIQMMANQDSIANYSSITKFFSGKDRAHIRTRYLTLTKWMRRYPGVDIAKAPRRAARRLGHGQLSENLSKAIEKLKNRIQSEVNEVKTKKVTGNSPEEVIDDAIIAYLATENVRLEEAKKLESYFEEQTDLECDTVKPNSNLDVRNLRKILILLRANLNKEKFTSSSISAKYRGLTNPDPDILTVQVKSYSKKNTVKNITIAGIPDIWGNVRLGTLKYVLPPHYATITGCKKLMSYLQTKPRNDDVFNIKVVLRRNVHLKEQMFLLMERFNALFLWPMLLSNTPPDPSVMNKPLPKVIETKSLKRIVYNEVDYNKALPSYVKSNVVNDVIDLRETQQYKDVTCTEINYLPDVTEINTKINYSFSDNKY